MSELHDVLRAIEDGAARGERMALATIVGIRGSTYRREGARLAIPATGAPVGTISGGCLEGEVCTVAGDERSNRLPISSSVNTCVASRSLMLGIIGA